jgi:hypothetical protein
VFDNVGQRFAHDVVRRDLDMLRQPLLDVHVQLDWNRRTAAQRAERRLQASFGQDRGVNSVGDLPQLVERARQPVGNAGHDVFELTELKRRPHLCRTQLQPE